MVNNSSRVTGSSYGGDNLPGMAADRRNFSNGSRGRERHKGPVTLRRKAVDEPGAGFGLG